MQDPGDAASRLVLIRHGEARCAVEGVIGGPKGCTGLSALGVEQAQALHERLRRSGELAGAAALYSSELERAVQTARVIAPALRPGIGLVRYCALCELHPGDADAMTWSEFAALHGEPGADMDPDVAFAPGAESWNEFVGRASAALTGVVSPHPGELVVVVCHAGVIEASLISFLPVAPGRGRLRLPTLHTSITEWHVRDGAWQLARYNDAAHLSVLM